MTQIPDQASKALNATFARSVYGVDGTGIVVGILSDTFNQVVGLDNNHNPDTMATDIANGYLPADTQILMDDTVNGGHDEGRGMAQIVHQIAPGASILYATATLSMQQYADNIRALAAAGAKVIVDDYIYFEEPSYQDGIVAQAIAEVVAQGVIYLAAASNDGANGYEAPFNAGASHITHNSRTETLHDFAPGDPQLKVTIAAGLDGGATFLLQWASPAASASPGHGATSDLDLYLVDGSGNVVAFAKQNNIGGDPYEEINIDYADFPTGGTYYLEVGLRSGAAPADFRIIGSDNAGGFSVALDHPASSITKSTFFGHFASADVIAVGAAKYTQTPAFDPNNPPFKEFYTTFGPNYVYYDVNGNLLPTPEVRTIAVTGVDNADTSFFGSTDFDHDGFRNFSGTSAAAPSVAAVVALMLQANIDLTAADVRHLLQDSAIKMGNPDATGAGLVQADRAVAFALTQVIAAYPDGNDTLLGTHLKDTIVGDASSETFTGYGGEDIFTGGGGADLFADTFANLDGSTFTDFSFNDVIDLTDLAFSPSATAAYSVLTHTLVVDSHDGTIVSFLLPSFAGGSFNLISDGLDGTYVGLEKNLAPVLDLNGANGGTSSTINYIAGNAPKAISPHATITDATSPDFVGGLLRASLSGHDGPEDQLSILTDGAVGVSGNTVSVNGAPIGTIDPAHNGANGATLVINFTTAAATPDAVAMLLEHIAYSDTIFGASTATRTVTFTLNDGDGSASGGNPIGTATATVKVALPPAPVGTPTAGTGNQSFTGGPGIDTISFNFKLTDATVSYVENQVIVDGPGSHTSLTGYEVFKFTDGTVTENDGDPLVDDLFYYSQNHDVWLAGADADAHYHMLGWREGRDPDAFFSTATYLSLNPAVKAAGIDPLLHYDATGWKSGADPSIAFDTNAYLDANPDVKAAGVDPLAHFLQFGAGEGRLPPAPNVLLAPNGFDYVYYLQNDPDVAAAHVDPLLHYETSGWKEGRNPNALFDDSGYLATYADVNAAGVNPLDHYNQFGWHEGRDPSGGFDTKSYLAAYPDVAAAGVNPLIHFLQFGQLEGRSPFADGVLG